MCGGENTSAEGLATVPWNCKYTSNYRGLTGPDPATVGSTHLFSSICSSMPLWWPLLTKKTLYCISKYFSGKLAQQRSWWYLLQVQKHLGFSYLLLDQFSSILIFLITFWHFNTSHCGSWTSVWLTPYLQQGKWVDKVIPIDERQEVFSISWHFPSFYPNGNILGLSSWKQKSAQGQWVNTFC